MQVSEQIQKIKSSIPHATTLVAVSKTKPKEMILDGFESGHLDFGENKVQDLTEKYEHLPKEIHWHFIGHLQSNKVKYIAPFVYLIHGVDSLKLLRTINKEAKKNDRTISCLLQIKIAEEETKFGLSQSEAQDIISSADFKSLDNIRIAGLMGMASNVNDEQQVGREFASLKTFFDRLKNNEFSLNTEFNILSMGMSGDYKTALQNGSNMIRIGSAIFGARQY